MSVSFPCWARVSNAVEDPQTKTAVAQDQVIQLTGEDGDWYIMKTLDEEFGRVPKILTNPIANPLRTASEKVLCSTAQYDAQKEGDLAFGIFTIIVSDSIPSGGYCTGVVVTDAGKRLGASGTFPVSFVKELTGFVPPPSAPPAIPSSFTTNFTDVRFREASNSNYNVLPYARAVYPFTAEFANELSLNVDDIVTLTRRVDKDWLEGSVNGKSGIFPQSFVQIVVDLPSDGQSDSENKRHSTTEEGIGFAIVRHDFIARQNDELTVKMGDSVRILKMVNTDWVSCKDPSTDASGIVPVAFLEVYLDEDEDDAREPATQTRPASYTEQSFSTLTNTAFTVPPVVPDWRTSTRFDNVTPPSATQSHAWATFGDDWNIAEKKPPPARPPPPKVTSMSPSDMISVTEMLRMEEKQNVPIITASNCNLNQDEKRSKVLEELINTELQFITDINAYTEAVDGSTRLSTKQKVIMKNGCAQVVELARALVQGLTNEQLKPLEQQMIGECFLRLRKSFANTYGYYFRNIDHINSLLMASKTDAKIETALRELVVRMRASGAGVFDASTAVSRPVQRCVKYPLFLSEIAKYTAITHPDHPKLLEAVKQLSHLGSKMNESKRRKELTRKYTEEQSNATLGDKLSKFTVHSIKKKTNRFTYRMGSSLGVVKVTRDADFDRLVCELDQAERRLVRFNYMLVIYRKKMFYETRQLIQKRLIEPRKREVPGVSADAQTFPFHDMIKDLAVDLNSRVRDEIVKALRAIPKKLIKKRNDKLMDYEAAKSSNKMKSDFMSKFKDFEALNNQVKQTLPKVIDVLNSVLRDAMKTVDELDSNLISRIRSKFQEEIAAYQSDPLASSSRLIVPGMSCFANYYDPDRLKALHNIVNKASKSVRLNSVSFSPTKQKSNEAEDILTKSAASDWKETGGENLSSPQGAVARALADKKAFRAQTEEERTQILVKADLKNRRGDIYRCMSEWPTSVEALELNKASGKMLIVRPGDAVLAVRRDPCNMWLCYNGYYNALLPSTILTPWYGPDGVGGIDLGIDALSLTNKTTPAINRPHSTPPKQQTTNLIDLDDDLLPSGACQPLMCTLTPLAPTPVGAAASVSSLEPEPPSIDWGVPSSTKQPTIRAPSLPNLTSQNSPAFPVTFEEETTATTGNDQLHQLPPAPVRLQNAFVPSQTTSSARDPFTVMWEQIKNVPLSNITQRSESPQPIIPTRPAFDSVAIGTSSLPALTPQMLPGSTAGVSNISSTKPTFDAGISAPSGSTSILHPSPMYDVVPGDITPSSSQTVPTYTLSPRYDVVPGSTTAASSTAPGHMYPVLYEVPPTEEAMAAIPAYDTPPVENGRLPSIGKMSAVYDFKPVGPNQLEIVAGERLDLIQAHDDGGNPEWIWVQRTNGEHGFVPAAYCKAV